MTLPSGSLWVPASAPFLVALALMHGPVHAQFPHVELSTANPDQTVRAGQQAVFIVSINRTSYLGAVNLAVAGLPTDASASFSDNPAAGASTTLIVTTTAETPIGSTALTISAATQLSISPVTVTMTVRPCSVRWMRQFGTESDDRARAVRVDNAGNVYVLGRVVPDTFVGKYDSAGQRLPIRYELPGKAIAIDVDEPGNLYVAGVIRSSASSATPELPNIWVAKYDGTGAQSWLTKLGPGSVPGAGSLGFVDQPQALVVDRFGAVYVVGDTPGALGGSNPLPGNYDAWAAKLDSNGAQQWIKQWGGHYHDGAFGVAVDGFGSIFVRGLRDHVAFIAKYDALGAQQWIETITSEDSYLNGDIGIDSSGDAYVAVYPMSTPAQLAKYDRTGKQVWIKSLATSGLDVVDGLAVDAMGSVYVAGSTYPSPDQGDARIVRFDGGGNELWTRDLATAERDSAFDIAVEADGHVYVVGPTQGNLGALNQGTEDAWIAKIAQIDCDDSDGDGVLDDGDESGTVADNRCISGNTQNCDDNCRRAPNSDQADGESNQPPGTSGDGVGDVCDNCVAVFNPDQSDTDGDAATPMTPSNPLAGGDACDCDDDNDSLQDPLPSCGPGPYDNCQWIFNPDQEDLDNDLIGFACDPAERSRFVTGKLWFDAQLLALAKVLERLGLDGPWDPTDPPGPCPVCDMTIYPTDARNVAEVERYLRRHLRRAALTFDDLASYLTTMEGSPLAAEETLVRRWLEERWPASRGAMQKK